MSKKKEIRKKPGPAPLKGISDIRRYFYRNETPIYFISATNFNLLGADEWIKGFKFITYIQSFDGLHPNVFCPKEIPHEEFQSIEDINNYLLEHRDVVDFVRKRGKTGKVLFLMFDERTEELARKLGLEVCFPSAKLRNYLDNKVVTSRVAQKAGVPCVPNILCKIDSFQDLMTKSKEGGLGTDLVVQTPYGDSGQTTFFIKNEVDFEKYADQILKESEVKVMKRINCRGSAIEACVTRHGTIVAPLMTELIGFKELTAYKGGWCGNEIYATCFTKEIRTKARKYTEQFGEQLRKEGYKGYFELDFLIDEDSGELYLGELNPRVTGASSITNHAVFALADVPLFIFHLLEWMDVEYELNVQALNKRWSRPENIDDWGQLVIKWTDDSVGMVNDAPRSGIWTMDEHGEISFNRMDTHRRAVESEHEAFFLRILTPGNYHYKGADMGILVMRGRVMTDDNKLTWRANQWITKIRERFVASPLLAEVAVPEAETSSAIGGFKMM
jgi:hypothetical protein